MRKDVRNPGLMALAMCLVCLVYVDRMTDLSLFHSHPWRYWLSIPLICISASLVVFSLREWRKRRTGTNLNR